MPAILKRIITVLLCVLAMNLSSQKIVAGIHFPSVLKQEEQQLVLNGAGVRKKFKTELYALGLYVKSKSSDAGRIMEADETMMFRLHVVSALLTSSKMQEATDEGFERVLNGKLHTLKKEIDQFNGIFKEKTKKGDVLEFVYVSGKGTHIYKNSKLLLTIKGLEFKRALFGLWLYQRLPETDLRDKLMGQQ